MIYGDYRPRALFGAALRGNQLMRILFVDEAGHSYKEPNTVVAGVLVHADNELTDLEHAINDVLGSVPPHFKDNFIFHAKSIWGDKKYREDWSMSSRLSLLKEMMAIPRKMRLPVCFGVEPRGGAPHLEAALTSMLENKLRMSIVELQHFLAFMYCVTRADNWIRKNGKPKEIGMVIYEDYPEARRWLSAMVQMARETPIFVPERALRPTQVELSMGRVAQVGEFRVSRFRNSVAFAQKTEEPVLQVVDAVAFGFRRFLDGAQFGDEFCEAILGKTVDLRNFQNCSSAVCYDWSSHDRL